MVESGISGIGVDLLQGNFEVSVESSQNNSWSLGCSVFVEDSNTDVQEFRTKDIALSACFQTEQITVDVNRVESNKELDVDFAINELDVNFGIGGIGGSGGAIVDEINGVKDSINEVSNALLGVQEEAVNIKVAINGIQGQVNHLGTELTLKADTETVTQIGNDIIEVQNNAYQQSIKIGVLETEIEEKATSKSVTDIAGQVQIINGTVAEHTTRVSDLEATIVDKADANMVTKIGDDLVIAQNSIAAQGLRVTALESEITTKAETETVNSIGERLVIAEKNVASQKITTDTLSASIETLVTHEEFDTVTGDYDDEFTKVKQTTDNIEASIKTQDGKITAITATVDGLSVGIKTINEEVKSIKGQIDGVTESFFYDYTPTIENEPALSWITNGSEEEHKGDTFTNTSLEGEDAGKSWRWLETDGVWGWVPIADTDAQKALLLASQAQAAADGKVTIFYALPSNYKIGDIWFVHNDDFPPFQKGELVSAISDSSLFDITHWESKTRYTEAVNDLNDTMNGSFRDGVIDNAERNAIKESFSALSKEKEAVDSRYNVLIVNTAFTDIDLKDSYKSARNTYITVYRNLEDCVNSIISAKPEDLLEQDEPTEEISEEEIKELFHAHLQELFDTYKKMSEDYGKAYVAYNTKEAEVTEALMGRMNPANVYLENIINDGVLTPIEKEQLYEIYLSIAREYDATKGNAFNYKIWKEGADETEEAGINGDNGRFDIYVAFRESYAPIVSVFSSDEWGFTKMKETTVLDEGYDTSILKGYLDAYYAAHGALTEVFSAITAAIEEAQKRGEETLAELTNILAPEEMDTKIGKGVVLSTIIATKDTQGNITAGMNASNEFSDATHKRVVIAGGVNDKTDWNDSEFKLYEDGHFVAQSGELGENVKIGNALITSVLYGDINLLSYPENGKLIPLFTIEKDASGKISSVSSAYDFKVNGNLLVYGESATRAAGDPSTGGGIDENKLAEYLRDYKYINEDALLEYNFADEAYVNSEIAKITPASLGVYTTSEVDAKVNALGIPSLKEKVEGIESTLGDDVSGKINTWNEIVNFLDEYDGSKDLATILSKMQGDINSRALGSDLNETIARVEDNEGAIEDLQGNKADKATTLAGYGITNAYTKEQIDVKLTGITTDIDNLESSKASKDAVNAIDNRLKAEEDVTKTYAAWWKDLMTYVKVVDGNVVIDTNLLVEGESATRGVGDPSTGGGIDLNALEKYLEEYKYINEDALLEYGFATEQDVNDAISALNIGDYAKTSEVERLFTALNIGQYAKTVDVNSALGGKVDKVSGKGLSTNDFTTALLNKLNAIAEGAEVNVQSDWNATSGDAFIKNKPTLGALAAKDNVAWSEVQSKPTFADVATSGAYTDLSGTPDLSVYATTSEMERLFLGLNISQYAKTSELGDLAFVDSLSKSDVGLGNVANETYAGGTAVTLNGFSKAKSTASFYAPTSAGTVGYFLKSQGVGDAPIWAALGALATKDSLTYSDVGVTKDVITFLIGTTTYAPYNANGYLPLSGGEVGGLRVKGGGNAPFGIQSTAAGSWVGVRFYDNNGDILGNVGVNNNEPIFVPKELNAIRYIIHSGNIGSQNAGSATKLKTARTIWGQSFDGSADIANQHLLIYKNPSGSTGAWVRGMRAMSSADSTLATFAFHGSGDTLIKAYIGNSYTSPWVSILPSGNVGIGTADPQYKLDVNGKIRFEARTIWGQSFDGTGNVSGDIRLNTSKLYWYNNATHYAIYCDYTLATGAPNLNYYAYSGHAFYSQGATRMIINSSGNVTIGGSDLAGTSAKLYVDGSTAVKGKLRAFLGTASELNVAVSNSLNEAQLGVTSGGTAYLFCTGAYDLGFSTNSTRRMTITSGGNVGIGTTSPAYKLDVNGTARISGAVTMSSTLSVGGQTTINNDLIVYGESASTSDMRFKDVVENKSLSIADIAKAPCFSFTWKEKDDKSLHLGTSAQYWEAIAPELVTGEDFKALNYASLGVAMGIALAKESINHEERIKALEDEIKILNGELKRLRYGIHQ